MLNRNENGKDDFKPKLNSANRKNYGLSAFKDEFVDKKNNMTHVE